MSNKREPGWSGTPEIGALDQLDLDRRREPVAPPPRPAPPRRARWPWWLAGAALLLVVAVLALWRERISETLIPDSELNQEIEAAQLALARGELSRADGQGARERFQAVLARDPDHPAARSGLVAVREAALVQARAALADGDLAAAHEHLALARAMAAPLTDIGPIEAALAGRESAEADIADRLQRARTAQAEGRIEQVPDGALALYLEVLRLQPDNAIALEGRRSILAGLLSQADAALDDGDAATATALVARVVDADPSHLGLPGLQARLGEARAETEQARERALQAALTDLRAGRPEAAARGFLALLAASGDDIEARQGLDDAAAALAARAGREAADFDFEAAEASLAQAREWAPALPAVTAAQVRLERAHAARDAIPETPDDPRALAAALDQARAAMRAGDLIDPPGASAWDHLRRAAAIAPGHADLREAQGEYDRRARACFEDELAGNRLGAAQACLDAMAVRERGGGSLDDDRRRLADRWLAFAEERLGASELALARRALDAARGVDPSNPRLDAFAERLRRAGG
ncbi:hypothetical protein [Arenimonas caeni]|uniref:Uncharacterized protein n=1 Tax=Arenimonas caeni TaxID=2058085 RepID=A0A2P6MBV5_9GAMM|nr:hypothetical protein [Arenimonas caeni]PRH83452.1 hypothetical protein C6N40_02040 [Arenimonas caeni]